MRKLIVSIHLSLDGYYASVDGTLDWQFPFWAEDLDRFALQQLLSMDSILLGRRTYEAMALHWPNASPSAYAQLMNSYPKFVVSRQPLQPGWTGSSIVSDDLLAWVRQSKARGGKDTVVYGSVSLVHALADAGLVDEYRFWIHPLVLGSGLPFFSRPMQLKHLRSLSFSTGVVVQAYCLSGSLYQKS